ncbi:hypothetical protein MKEN_01355400 [Mycena kentingensis (nom. inval.)]|nr:hypothetical protein MKEN_01355400 [Mycena kentingensis (nom. inval.)]
MCPLASPSKLAAYRAGVLPQPSIEHLKSPSKQIPKRSGTLSVSQGNHVAVLNPQRPRKPRQTKPQGADSPQSAPQPDFPQPDFHVDLGQASGGGVRKRVKQYEKWQSMLPLLVDAYLALLRETMSLHDLAGLNLGSGPACPCHKRVLNLTVIRFTGAFHSFYFGCRANDALAMEEVGVNVCGCAGVSAPEQLICAGLFPCSPTNPTLAVDINVLSLFQEFFLHIAPNNTALCKTLENFLAFRGYKLELGQRLRIRFGNAYTWFMSLVYAARKCVDDAIVPPEPEPEPVPSSPPPSASAPAEQANRSGPKTGSKRARCDDVEDEDDAPSLRPKNPFLKPPPRTEPSAYLRRRCPACFEGLKRDPTQTFDVSVCIDTCFTQKIRALFGCNCDPARIHAYSVFLARELAEVYEEYVEGTRSAGKQSKKARVGPEVEDDSYLGKMRVPESTLNGYSESFRAADEKRGKATSTFFAHTGLMCMVCRHDQVLFMVSMTSVGEKQHYALLLFEKLFQHLPEGIIVGGMYDIACQLARSCELWGFLGSYQERLVWAVSVFHAFAHRWGCQLIFHPQKCIGFGDTNGEGSERNWNELSHLVGHFRTCGYHQQNFVLDSQVDHGQQEKLKTMAHWVKDRTRITEGRLESAQEILSASKVAYQTCLQPPRRSKNQAAHAIKDIILIERTIELLEQRADALTKSLGKTKGGDALRAVQEKLADAQAEIEKETSKRTRLMKRLGADELAQLQDMQLRAYHSAKLAARTIREQLLAKLTQRKLEMDPVERAVCRTTSEEKKNEHVTAAIRKREPTIKKLVKQFNAQVGILEKLIQRRKAPRNAVAPTRLQEDKIFDLEIDDDAIRWGIGLEDDDDATRMPKAIIDADIRRDVNALLQKQRCLEERHRLRREHGHLRIWFARQWQAINDAIQDCDDANLLYQLMLRREDHLQLMLVWRRPLMSLDIPEDVPAWGPTDAEHLRAIVDRSSVGWKDRAASDISSVDGEDRVEEEAEEEDPALIGVLNTIDREPEDADDDEQLADVQKEESAAAEKVKRKKANDAKRLGKALEKESKEARKAAAKAASNPPPAPKPKPAKSAAPKPKPAAPKPKHAPTLNETDETDDDDEVHAPAAKRVAKRRADDDDIAPEAKRARKEEFWHGPHRRDINPDAPPKATEIPDGIWTSKGMRARYVLESSGLRSNKFAVTGARILGDEYTMALFTSVIS